MSDKEEEFKPEPLDRDQIAYAWELIAEFHPLQDTPIPVAYPYLKYIWPSSKKDDIAPEQNSVTEPLLEKKKAVIKTKNGKEIELKKKPRKKKSNMSDMDKADPINMLGFGIVAYRDLLYALIWVFGILSLVMLPSMILFSKGTGYSSDDSAGQAINSIGNLGYSSVQCANIPLGVKKIAIQCPYGSVGEIFSYGVQPPVNNLTSDICSDTEENHQCQPNNPDVVTEVNKAVGSDYTSFDFDKSELWTSAPDETCLDPMSTLFVQYSCVQSETEQNGKFKKVTVAVSSAVFVSLLFSWFVIGFYNKQKLNQLQWDMSTVTVADYAVEFPIPPDKFADWYLYDYCKEDGDRDNGVPIARSLKRQLKEKIEKFLTDDRAERAGIVGSNNDGRSRVLRRLNQIDEVKVADITFGYANEDLIFALQKRGSMIAHNQFHKVSQEDQKIAEVVLEKYDQLTRPTAAFIIFEEEEGAATALKASGKKDRDIMGLPVKFQSASEPTDIIWENRHYFNGFNTDIFCCRADWKESRVCREILGYSFVIVSLALSFLFILYLASLEIKFTKVFPPQNCDAVLETYGDSIEEYAYYDYMFVTHTQNQASSGCLMCFCDQQVKELGRKGAVEANYSAPGRPENDICSQYLALDMKSYILSTSFSYILIGFNYVLRTIVIAVVVWIGYATQTAQLERITTVTFLCQFFNTAFILMLVNADLSEQPITLMFKWGQNGDFNSSFYKTIGNQLVSTMVFNMYYPLIEFLMYWAMRVAFRVLDRGFCSCSKWVTHSKSVKAYQDVYSGPSYYIHYKYSTILNTVFVTFMFGFGMPIFFPIALGSMTILYFIEKSMLYWSYQQPPMYDERLNDSVLSKLKYAPLFFLAFGYWMASSNQLLSNEFLTPVYKESDTRETGHVFQDIFSANGWSLPAFPLVTMFFLTLFFCWFGQFIMPCIEKCCPAVRIAAIDIDQPIDSYFASVDEEDREWTIKEEENSRANLQGMRILTDESYEKMRDTPQTKGATLQGVHSYDILCNPLYSDMFQYVSAAVPNRADFIIDDDDDEGNDCVQSDLVRAVMNLAYMTEEKAKNFKFNQQDFSKQLAGKETDPDA